MLTASTELSMLRQQARKKHQHHIIFLCGILMTATVLGISKGALEINLFSSLSDLEYAVVVNIRIPRVLMTIVTGAGLAMCGLVLQAITRNPLAEPGIMGVSLFAALFASIAIFLSATLIFPSWLAMFFIPVMSFIGALISLFLLIAIAGHKSRTNTLVLILTGVALNAAAATLLGLVIYLADDETLRAITFWQMGSYSGVMFEQVCIAFVFVGAGLAFFHRNAKQIMVLQIGENHARFQGIPVNKLKRFSLILVALVTAVCVCFTGIVGFVGLIVPHIARMLVGSNINIYLPCSMLLGASLVTLADLGARLLVVPAELPIGLLTSTLGVPFFLGLILKEKRKYSGD